MNATLRYSLLSTLLLGAAVSTGCGKDAPPTPESGLHIAVAPLSLPGIKDVCYTLEVRNDQGQTVWKQAHLCSTQFGDGVGDVSYIGTCDAQDANTTDTGTALNTVTLTIENIYTAPVDPTNYSSNAVADTEWVNPCGTDAAGTTTSPNGDGFGPCQLTEPCVENQDTFIDFNVTVMRNAQQGFFDIAVNFEDIFCSAKLDCRNDSNNSGAVDTDDDYIQLLHNGSDRDDTVILGLACSAGPGQDTHLYWTDITVNCGGVDYDVNPSGGPGNLNVDNAVLFQAATYRGAEQLETDGVSLGTQYWNVALGLKAAGQAADCTIRAKATAHDGPLTDGATPAGTTYPYVAFAANLSTCTRHPMGSDEVKESYTGLSAQQEFAWFSNATEVGPTVASCDDSLRNGDESDVDCGGSCGACIDGKFCSQATDCISGVCTDGRCAAPACDDAIQNGDESDVNCGGSLCEPCADGKICTLPIDCASGLCDSGTCVDCDDNLQNGTETGVDCGGATCDACPTCDDGLLNQDETAIDCGGACAACPTCSDGILNQDETDVDCGGATCDACPTCSDGILNQDETAIDCGGAICAACVAAPTCSDGLLNQDETDVDCGGDTCDACPTCEDGIKNQDETDVDCGGTACYACAAGADCLIVDDCFSGSCDNHTCADCADGIRNRDETSVDCGGVCGGTTSSGNLTINASNNCIEAVNGDLYVDADAGETITLPNLTSVTGSVTINPLKSDATIHLPLLVTIPGGLIVQSSSAPGSETASLQLPTLESIGDSLFMLDSGLGRLSLPALETVSGQGIFVSETGTMGSANLTSVSLPALHTATQLIMGGSSKLTSLNLDALHNVTTALSVTGTHVSQCYVDLVAGRVACYSDPDPTFTTSGNAPCPTCADNVKNVDETDVDCGGPSCLACADGQICELDSDCMSHVCTDGTCGAPVCPIGSVNVGGDVVIDALNPPSADIACIETIAGNLSVIDYATPVSFPALTAVDGDVSLHRSIVAVPTLATVGNDVLIRGPLAPITLPALTAVGRSLTLWELEVPASAPLLTTIGEYLYVDAGEIGFGSAGGYYWGYNEGPLVLPSLVTVPTLIIQRVGFTGISLPELTAVAVWCDLRTVSYATYINVPKLVEAATFLVGDNPLLVSLDASALRTVATDFEADTNPLLSQCTVNTIMGNLTTYPSTGTTHVDDTGNDVTDCAPARPDGWLCTAAAQCDPTSSCVAASSPVTPGDGFCTAP